MITDCWGAIGGDPLAVDRVTLSGRDAWLGGPLAVDALAVGACAAALLAAAELAEARSGRRPSVALDAAHVALSFSSERHARRGGRPAGPGFAPLSRFVRCAGSGWIRTHGNYPHHAAALARALGASPESLDPAVLEAAAAERDATELEEAVITAGGCAAALRTASEWAEHPAGRAAGAAPLVALETGLATRAAPRGAPPGLDDLARPAAGLRVLDLTRVIAGPVAGRTLAALGAEVLRVDAPHLPELAAQHLDTGAGKRTAVLDLVDSERREALLAGADVVLMGYRPGALDRFALAPDHLAERHPHLVVVTLSAWGTTGPWSARRGFDSLVQVASGIAAECASPDGRPGTLPCQALDHASGHLMAGVALRGLAGRLRGEPVAPARLALARTAAALLSTPRPQHDRTPATGAANPDAHSVRFGDLTLISPPGALDGTPLRWAHGPRELGSDPPSWG